jgi:hypothetical protein
LQINSGYKSYYLSDYEPLFIEQIPALEVENKYKRTHQISDKEQKSTIKKNKNNNSLFCSIYLTFKEAMNTEGKRKYMESAPKVLSSLHIYDGSKNKKISEASETGNTYYLLHHIKKQVISTKQSEQLVIAAKGRYCF